MKKQIIIRYLILVGMIFSFCVKSSAASQEWEVDPHDFQYDMSLYLSIWIDDTELDYDKYTVGAFVGDELRGVGKTILYDGMDSPCVLIRVWSNLASGETLSLRAVTNATGEIIDVPDSEMAFVAGSRKGYPSAPLSIGKPFTLGDLDNNGKFNALDVSKLVNVVMTGEGSDLEKLAGDMDANGIYNALDVSKLVSLVMQSN